LPVGQFVTVGGHCVMVYVCVLVYVYVWALDNVAPEITVDEAMEDELPGKPEPEEALGRINDAPPEGAADEAAGAAEEAAEPEGIADEAARATDEAGAEDAAG
jgi:hypothetical protein